MAASNFSEALVNWPKQDQAALGRIALEVAKSQIEAGDLIAGQDLLTQLIDSLEQQPVIDSPLVASARHELGMSSYYAAWIMRLEGASTEQWLNEAENARQQFRWIAEQQTDRASTQFHTAAENVEAVIRLEQMDLDSLMARPLPKNCCSNCNNLCKKKKNRSSSQCNNPGENPGSKKKKNEDVREQIKQSNSASSGSTMGTGS